MRAVNQYRPHEISLPPTGVCHPKIKPIAEKYAQLRDQESKAAIRYTALQDAREKAMQTDRQALADALRGGKPDPGYAAVTAADSAIDEARRDLDALQVAVDDQRTDLSRALAKHADEHKALIAKRVAAARGTLQAALDEVAVAHDALAHELSMAAWVHRAPEARWKPALNRVDALPDRSGEGHGWPAVLNALRDHARPPVVAPSSLPPAYATPLPGPAPGSLSVPT